MKTQSIRGTTLSMEADNPSDLSENEQTVGLLTKDIPRQKYTIDDAIDKLGIGRIQVLAMLFTYLTWMYAGVRLAWLALYFGYSRCSFGINAWQLALVAQAFYLGRVIGGFVSGPLVDRFGRKSIATILSLFGGYFQLLQSLPPTYSWLVVLSLIQGFVYCPVYPASLAYCAELQPSKYRKAFGSSLPIAVFLGGLLVYLFCLLAVSHNWSWRLANAFSALSSLTVALLSVWLPESPHFNISRQKFAEVESLLKQMATENGVQLPTGQLAQSKEVTKQLGKLGQSSWKLLCTPLKMCFVTIGIIIARSFFSFNHQAYNFFATSVTVVLNKEVNRCPPFGTLDFLNMIWLLSSEVFAGVAAPVALMLWRQRLVMLVFGIGSCLPLLFLVLPQIAFTEAQTIALIFIGRSFGGALNQSSYVFIAEFFPSVARGKAFGTIVGVTAFCALLAPYVGGTLAVQNLFAAKIIILTAYCIGIICMFGLPDVTSKKLEDTLFTTG